jgi:tetratricopeptide (TPR) repeat protein
MAPLIVAAWLPALLVLSGRMYVRPETLTFFYIAVFLAILSRIDRRPGLALLLPMVQVLWVNTQGLFVFGPILYGSAMLEAALRTGAFDRGRKGWWRVVVGSAALTGLACLVNPYGLRGALYPLQIAGTMANPVFSQTIAELTPIPVFIQRGGLGSLPLRLQLLTLLVGALSFLGPVCWLVWSRLKPTSQALPGAGKATPARAEKPASTRSGKSSRRGARGGNEARPPAPSYWGLSVFRLLLFAFFSLLSFQATRNSHQFAAVVGTITAWNLGEWAAGLRRRALERSGPEGGRPGRGLIPRVLTLGAVLAVTVWVATGSFYRAANEGRAIGLGEEPLWYPHDAVKFCGTEGMPDRFLGFHIGHASLYDYYFGPDRKVWVDARLEVIGPELYERYSGLQRLLTRYATLREPDPAAESLWRRELDDLGRPAVLADHAHSTADVAALLNSRDWRCVWFDPVASVFVHVSHDEVIRKHGVDFARRHFLPDPAFRPKGRGAWLASAKALRDVVWSSAILNPGRSRPLVLLGLSHAREVVEMNPTAAEGWKMLGQIEMFREPTAPASRFRQPFDPVLDLSPVRATYALRRASELSLDFSTLLTLQTLYQSRRMTESALPLIDRMLALDPINNEQTRQQEALAAQRPALLAELGPEPPASWANLSELGQIVGELLARGRAATAADYLERAAPVGTRSWDETDRIATLRMHLGEPAAARSLWQGAVNPPNPAVIAARIAATFLTEGEFVLARASYAEALAADPNCFEALFGLAVLEQDDGRAREALEAARRAVSAAPSEIARSASQEIVAIVTPYAIPPIAALDANERPRTSRPARVTPP